MDPIKKFRFLKMEAEITSLKNGETSLKTVLVIKCFCKLNRTNEINKTKSPAITLVTVAPFLEK